MKFFMAQNRISFSLNEEELLIFSIFLWLKLKFCVVSRIAPWVALVFRHKKKTASLFMQMIAKSVTTIRVSFPKTQVFKTTVSKDFERKS